MVGDDSFITWVYCLQNVICGNHLTKQQMALLLFLAMLMCNFIVFPWTLHYCRLAYGMLIIVKKIWKYLCLAFFSFFQVLKCCFYIVFLHCFLRSDLVLVAVCFWTHVTNVTLWLCFAVTAVMGIHCCLDYLHYSFFTSVLGNYWTAGSLCR